MAFPEYPSADVEDYLRLDNSSQSAKYEYSDGVVTMLAGGIPNHAQIAANLVHLLSAALWNTPCNVYTSDVRLKVSEDKYFHPDMAVSGHESDTLSNDHIQHPRLVGEVLSPGTEGRDRGMKLFAYLNCPSLQDY